MTAERMRRWRKEPGARLQGSRPLDSWKLQAPGIVPLESGGFRLFYTAVGPDKPYPRCQGYILSAVSDDGLTFRTELGIRVAPQPDVPHMSRRVLAPSLARLADGRWRMYFESRGPTGTPTVIGSAISSDLLEWRHEEGIRVAGFEGVGAPRFTRLPDGRGRIYLWGSEPGPRANGIGTIHSVVSAVSSDGLHFELEPGHRVRGGVGPLESSGITAAEVLPPARAGEPWVMVYSAWQDVAPGTVVPPHPSQDPNAEATGGSENFAAASIAADMAGFRSRIFLATSTDGLRWERAGCLIEGEGHAGSGIDAVHAEDMSLAPLADGRTRMYYAACDASGNWRIASAVTER